MIKVRYRSRPILSLLVLILFLSNLLSLGTFFPVLKNAAGERNEFEVEKFDENITISINSFQAIDIDLREGEEIEVVFALLVKEALPVDVWFVTEDHYTLLAGSAQFLYFVDGSEQEVEYTRKIVTLTEHDLYKLVITNYYNNQTVEVNIIYEIRTYYAESSDTTSDDLSMFVLPLSILVIVLVLFLLVLLMKIRGQKQAREKSPKKASTKKKKLRKSTKPRLKAKEKTPSNESKTIKSKEIKPEVPDKASLSFCGHCGTPITTPFCTSCGRKIH